MKRRTYRIAVGMLAFITIFSFAGLFTKSTYGKLQIPQVSIIPSEPIVGQHASVEAFIEIELC